MTQPSKLIDLDTAKTRVIERLAQQEIAADRERIAREEAAAAAQRHKAEREKDAAKLAAEAKKAGGELRKLREDCAEHVRALAVNFVEMHRLADKISCLVIRQRDLLGQPAPRWETDVLGGERSEFASLARAALFKASVPVDGFFAWLNAHAIHFAR